MLRRRSSARLLLLLLAMLLRGIVAPGYMPGGTHAFVVLCPDGLPRQVVTALFDDADSRSSHPGGHGDHGHHAADDPREEYSSTDTWSVEHCALGQAQSEVARTADPPLLPSAPQFMAVIWLHSPAVTTATRTGYRARAPPLRTSLV